MNKVLLESKAQVFGGRAGGYGGWERETDSGWPETNVLSRSPWPGPPVEPPALTALARRRMQALSGCHCPRGRQEGII